MYNVYVYTITKGNVCIGTRLSIDEYTQFSLYIADMRESRIVRDAYTLYICISVCFIQFGFGLAWGDAWRLNLISVFFLYLLSVILLVVDWNAWQTYGLFSICTYVARSNLNVRRSALSVLYVCLCSCICCLAFCFCFRFECKAFFVFAIS